MAAIYPLAARAALAACAEHLPGWRLPTFMAAHIACALKRHASCIPFVRLRRFAAIQVLRNAAAVLALRFIDLPIRGRVSPGALVS